MGELLHHLAVLEGSPPAFETRKWRVVLLEELLSRLPTDPTDALIELSEFWSAFDYPPDSPHIDQARDTGLTPIQYYTQDMFATSLNAHRAWIESELTALRR